MELKVDDQTVFHLYQEIGKSSAFSEVALFKEAGKIKLNNDKIAAFLPAKEIDDLCKKLQNLGVEALLNYRLYLYRKEYGEAKPFLKIVDVEYDLENDSEESQKSEIISRALQHLIDFNLYQMILDDPSHATFNILRETLFTIEDYCLQIEHTISLRAPAHKSAKEDELQLKLIEDEKMMRRYYDELHLITELAIKELKKRS